MAEHRALNYVLSKHWAITRDALNMILAIVNRENATPEAVAAELGRPLANTHDVTIRNGVATIPVVGPVFPRANMFTDISGATSLEVLATDFTTALENPDVTAILFEFDSPGGEVTGTSDLADLIFEARGTKPIVAHVSGLGASAAYWLASAADEVVASDTAILGSIGVMTTLIDTTEADEMLGIKEIDIVSSQSPDKTVDPDDPQDVARVKQTVNALADVMVTTIARNRGVSKATVLTDFGRGDVLVGKAGVKAGLADRVATFEDTHQALQKKSSAAAPRLNVAQLPVGAPVLAAACWHTGLLSRTSISTPKAQAQRSTAKADAVTVKVTTPGGADIEEIVSKLDRQPPTTTGTSVPSPDPQPVARRPEQPAPDEAIPLEDRMDDKQAAAPSAAENEAKAKELLAAERERTREIVALCREHDVPDDEMNAMINDGLTVDQAGAQILAGLKDRVKSLSQPGSEGIDVRVGQDRAELKPWASIGEQCLAVHRHAIGLGEPDKRLYRGALQGLGETQSADGGFLVDTDTEQDLTDTMRTGSELLSRVRVTPIGSASNALKRKLIDETSRADGSRAGGVRGYWVDEAATITASQPKFRILELTLNKVAALTYATDELLEDATALTSVINTEVPDELRFKAEDAIYNGDGAGKPLGVLNSPALVTQAIETGQTLASGFQAENFANMYSRLHPRSIPNSVWFINADVLPELMTSGITFGTGGQAIFMPAGFQGVPFNTILGRPVIQVEYAATKGTVGDILFMDLSRYETIEKGGVKAASSIHVQFVTEQTAFRFTWRIDGTTIDNSALTPFKGTNTVSSFVALAARS